MRRAQRRRDARATIWRVVRRAMLAGLFFGLGAIAGLAAVFYYFSASLPHIGPLLEGYDPPQTTRVVAADGTVLGELFIERRTVVPIARIPAVMTDAVIAAEDGDFRQHEGLDYPGMVRAMIANVTSGRLAQGASTITQQVARTFFLTREKKFSRKIREILLTRRIEEQLTKDEILYLYLNQINFGHARYGVQEASRFYFGKDISEVTVGEAALLAGIPKGPAIYSPLTHPDAALERRSYVLGEMAKLGMITAELAEESARAPLGLAGERGFDAGLAPEAVDRALDEIAVHVEVEQLRRGGYRIETTIDPLLQRRARDAVRRGLVEIDRRHDRLAPYRAPRRRQRMVPLGGEPEQGRVYPARVIGADDERGELRLDLGNGRVGTVHLAASARYNPEKLPPSRFAAEGVVLRVSLARPAVEGEPLALRLESGPQGALVALQPASGRVLALVGGDRVRRGGFDRATMARRQPGSTFKPFVYLEALRGRRYTPATLIDDAPVVDGEWRPQNATAGEFAGSVRLREALARSLNLPAVKLIRDVGPERVAGLAARLGVASPLEPAPSLALGASAVAPLEMASAYAVFAARGERHPPHVVARVVGPGGRELPLIGRAPQRVIGEDEAFLMADLLQSVVREGTGRRARKLGRPAGGKTGTSNEQRDAWFVGFTPDVSCAVWVGFDDFRSIGRKEYGGKAALPIWLDFMQGAHEGVPERGFERPPGVVEASVDPATGLLAYEGMEGAFVELFIEGTEPSEEAPPPDVLTLDAFLMGHGGADAGPDGGGDADAGPDGGKP